HRARRYTEADVRDLYACRAILEAEAMREVAARGLSAEQAAALERIVLGMEAILEKSAASGHYGPEMRDTFRRMNNEFHGFLYSLVQNRTLKKLIDQITDLPFAVRTFANFTPDQIRESHVAHKRILAALIARDAVRADALMREHIWAARDRVLQARDIHGDSGRHRGRRRAARRRGAHAAGRIGSDAR
ncbi:MAG TPA: FCD domain-containing protein, partial [Thermodesulfobacteriota bacterium]